MKIEKREDDQPTRCLFQKKNDAGEWKTYLTVGEYPLIEMKRVLVGLCSFKLENSTDE